jgi:hypothetical protein
VATLLAAALPAWEAASVPPRAALSRAGLESTVRRAIAWKRGQGELVAGLEELRRGGGGPEAVDRLREWILRDDDESIERLPLVVRWVELLLKGEGR